MLFSPDINDSENVNGKFNGKAKVPKQDPVFDKFEKVIINQQIKQKCKSCSELVASKIYQLKMHINKCDKKDESNTFKQLSMLIEHCKKSTEIKSNGTSNNDDSEMESDQNSDEEQVNSEDINDEDVNEEENYDEKEEEKEKFSPKLDPFSIHIENDELNEFNFDQLNNLENKDQIELEWNQLGKFVYTKKNVKKSNQLKVISDTKELCLRSVLQENIYKTILSYDKNRFPCQLNKFQIEMLSIIGFYKDMFYGERTFKNGEDIRLTYCIHALNHIFKTRSRILNHNHLIAQHKNTIEEYRDQGLTRPKVLILVPFKECALRIVKLFIKLMFGDSKDESGKKANVMNMKRFTDEFGYHDEEPIYHKKPEDYEETFSGNIDDAFRIGIAITKKSLKLYAEFYSCDILIASPLGMRTIIGAEGDRERDFDFLSSIEIMILDQADVFLMQNWEHVLHIRKHLHLQPKQSHGIDFSRVRMWTLEGWGKYYCQTLLFSSIVVPQLTSFFNKYSFNYEGQIITRNLTSSSSAPIQKVYIQCPQNFYRFKCDKIINSPDDRFNYFTSTILPKFTNCSMNHVLIYIPSYFDFVRLRNYFRQEELNFTQVCEYTEQGKVAKARSMFFHGGRHFMLFTERFHFFHRYNIKGIRHLIFYELPTFPHFYYEMINLMHPSMQGKKFVGDESSMSCTVLYNKFDALQLVSVLGNERANAMLQSPAHFNMIVIEK